MISNHGKKISAEIMLSKGKEFVEASLLLKMHYKKTTFVQYYLLLQGIEIICKSILIFHDYDKYKKDLNKNYNHKLLKLIDEVKNITNIQNIDQEFNSQLTHLIGSGNWVEMRNGTIKDIFYDSKSYKTDLIYKKLYQTLLILQKRISFNNQLI